jgi:uncharacterized membrane protein
MRWVNAVAILVLAVLLTTRFGGLLGSRQQVLQPIAEIINVQHDRERVTIEVKSNALYLTRLAVGFVIVDGQDVVHYRSDQVLIEKVEPLAEAYTVLPITNVQVEPDQRVEGVVEEYIASIDRFQTPEINETGGGVGLTQLRLSDGTLSGVVALVAPDGQAGTYRYKVSLVSLGGDVVFQTPFFEVQLAGDSAVRRVFRQQTSLEGSEPYQVVVWVQREETPGVFFHSIQYPYPDLLEEGAP